MSSKSSILFFTTLLLLVAVCTANLATGRASLRPSAGKRSVLVGRTPAHYYQLAAAAAVKRYENELTCSMHTMSILDARLQQLQEEIDEIVEVMEACHTIRAVNSL
ncbi:Protein CBG19658 [Caenorhabditis briggsae]|uniref:Uncharacterized protein n=2 Tax=Caenorhabditis briggsae TaxID=6238 RepID=A0AAE9EZE7_CAEBR|nr:Protein CBG19658 [Caenorhabditis briggsae]ULT97479.1 hypothetical protein L3Y34_005353 [Caenorhabditis briggsae]UMM30646.1 hypothetical protein L5515_012438 [Caenorhabditis briggsae]CAP36865.1 Protein CBG19658 [Caenorhabditis briggsae]